MTRTEQGNTLLQEVANCGSPNDQDQQVAAEDTPPQETTNSNSAASSCSVSDLTRSQLFVVEADENGSDLVVLSHSHYDITFAKEAGWDVVRRTMDAMLAAVDLQRFSLVKLYICPLGDTLAKLHTLPKKYIEELGSQMIPQES